MVIHIVGIFEWHIFGIRGVCVVHDCWSNPSLFTAHTLHLLAIVVLNDS